MTFDPENKATVFGTALTAGYTIEGVRAWKQNTATGTKTYFLYDGMTPVVELDAAGSVSATNTVGANGLVSRNVAGTGSVYYTFDERGTTAQRLDGFGAVLSSHMADAFGTMGTTLTGMSADPYDGYGAQFGYYSDHETGLVLCTFRYYDPSTGRWLNRDPIGYDGGINLYAYCLNSPITNDDPSGLDVSGYFDRKSGVLTVRDNQTNQRVTIYGVFSGKNGYRDTNKEHLENLGPIAHGKYLIDVGRWHHKYGNYRWYQLWGKDEKGNYVYTGIPIKGPDGKIYRRGNFNLHAGLGSAGCITAPSKNSKNAWNELTAQYPYNPGFERLTKMLDATKHIKIKGHDSLGFMVVK